LVSDLIEVDEKGRDTSDHRHLLVHFTHEVVGPNQDGTYQKHYDDGQDQEAQVKAIDARSFIFHDPNLLQDLVRIKDLRWTIVLEGVDKSFEKEKRLRLRQVEGLRLEEG